MRLRLLLAAAMACVFATPADSNPYGHDLWQVRMGPTLSGRWVLLDAGHAEFAGKPVPLVLLGLVREDRPPGRYYEMTVADGRTGSTLWTYDGTGSDYVDAGLPGPHGEGREPWSVATRPQLRDVDGDGSDDVLFIEQDFIFGTLLRAVRIEP